MRTNPRAFLSAGALLLSWLALPADPVSAARIQRHERHQARRIERGVSSGRLSPQEATRLEQKQSALRNEEQAMREMHGGRLGARQRRVVLSQQRHMSGQIWRQKHDHNGR